MRTQVLARPANQALAKFWPWIVGLVLILQGALVLTHKPWSDEWQAVQIAVQSPGLHGLIDQLRYEGHPPLWYLVIILGEAVSGPYGALPTVTLACALASQWLLLVHSPFSRFMRLGIALSAIVLFEYNTIARGYTLGVTLLFIMMATWDRQRLPWIMIALLPTLEFFFGIFSLIFIALRFAERKLFWPGLIVWALLAALSAYSVIPAHDNVPAYQGGTTLLTEFFRYIFQLSAVTLPIGIENYAIKWSKLPPFGLHYVLWIAFIVICLDETREDRWARLSLLGFMVFHLCFFMFVSPLSIRHTMLAALLLLVLQWRAVKNGHVPGRPFALWLTINAICGLIIASFNLIGPFSRSSDAAQYIRSQGLGDRHWTAFPNLAGQGVTALSGLRFERAGQNCMQEFVHWNFDDVAKNPGQLSRWLTDTAPMRERFYLLSGYPVKNVPAVQLMKHIPAGFDGWDFYLYVVNPRQEDWHAGMPLCRPGIRPFSNRHTIPISGTE